VQPTGRCPGRAVPCAENDVSRAATSRDEPAPDLSGRLTGDAHLQHVEAARLKKSQRVGRVSAGAAGLKRIRSRTGIVDLDRFTACEKKRTVEVNRTTEDHSRRSRVGIVSRVVDSRDRHELNDSMKSLPDPLWRITGAHRGLRTEP
jgi:hypothetical protein